MFVHIGKTGGSSITSIIPVDTNAHNISKYDQQHILDMVGEGTEKYFKFAFVRNPWDRCVSRYFYERAKWLDHRKHHYHGTTFSDFIFNQNNHFKLSSGWIKHSPKLKDLFEQKSPFEEQIDWISDENGNIIVDFIGRFENLQEDFNIVCDKIGIPRQELPHINKSKHKHYTEYYDAETRQIIAERYAKDIEMFGYTFDPPTRVKKLICLYTCEKDRKTLEEFKKTPLYTRMSNDSSMKVIEVHAGATETKLEDGKLYLSCKESYDELSVKTYEMIKYCVSNFDFEHLVKIDSSTFGYDARRNECLGDKTIQFLYSLGEIEKVLFSTGWFNKHGDYGGAVLQPRGDRRGVESWARNRGLTVSYDKEFQSRSPAYYTGKFYFLTKEMCQYIANTGEELAVRHVKNLGGAEDMYVGRMIAEQQDNQQWYETRASWNSDHIKSKVRKPTKKVVADRNNLIELPGDVSRDDKLVIMSCKHKRDDVTFVKRAKFGCSTLICENRRDGRGADDDPQLDYLNYIIDNYDNLPNHMVFVHDSPFSSRRDELTHRMFFQFAKLNIPTTGFVSFTKSSQHPQKHILSKFNRTWNRYIDYEPPHKFKGSSMFAVTKEMVLSKPKSWYCSMRSAVSFDGEFGGLLGYSWHHVFKKQSKSKVL